MLEELFDAVALAIGCADLAFVVLVVVVSNVPLGGRAAPGRTDMTARDVSTAELELRLRSNRDFGLVVGIDHYPRFRSLQGAAADAIAFHAWMCDPDGGGVAPEHARLITSTPEPPTPLQDHVDEQVVDLVQAADALGGGRRLYVYFSGHGTACIGGVGGDVALLLAKWSMKQARLALSSKRYCSALGEIGLFEEVAMFLDCCRTAKVGTVGLPPTFTCEATSAGPPARTFVAYATEAGRPAFEEPQEGVWHGTFTRRLLWILKRSPRGIEAGALKETLERELREDTVQRAHVVNGLRAGSMFGRRGVPPILQVKPDDEWEDDIELYDGMGQLVASHRPSAGTWALPLAVGLYKLTYGVAGERQQEIVDHGVMGPTLLDFRPRLRAPIVRVWRAATANRWFPERDDMQVFTLSSDEPLYIGSAPECTIRAEGRTWSSCDARIRREDECYVIEDLGSGLDMRFHGRIRYMFERPSLSGGKRIRTKQLRDGDLFRCGELRLMVGHVENNLGDTRCGEIQLELAAGVPPVIGELSLHCDPDVSVTVYDATGTVRSRGEGGVTAPLPHGLYRIEAELFDRVTSRVIDLDRDCSYQLQRPKISTPAVEILDDLSSHRSPAYHYSVESTTTPLGVAPQTSRLLVFLPRWSGRQTPRDVPSEPVSIHDEDGRPLTQLSPVNSHVSDGFGEGEGFVAFSCEVAPGTYCLRASRSRRNVAITIPACYAAWVFIADVGIARLDDMRISLAPMGAKLYHYGAIARAMEGVIAALRSPGRRLPEFVRAPRRTSITMDLCFGIAAAHALGRAADRAGLEEVLDALAPYAEVADVEILQHAYAPRAPAAAFALTTPPLLRASLQLAMTHPAFDLRDVPADSALARAACRGYADSIWCTWSHLADDECWIAPTVAELRRDKADVVALGRRLAIPPRRVQQALDELDSGPPDTARG